MKAPYWGRGGGKEERRTSWWSSAHVVSCGGSGCAVQAENVEHVALLLNTWVSGPVAPLTGHYSRGGLH